MVIMGLCSVCWAGGNPEDALAPPRSTPLVKSGAPAVSSFTGPADWVYQASDWMLNLYITGQGSRSQGSHGILLFEGKKVKGTPGEIRALPIGTVRYNGPAEARAHLWDDSGWQMTDPLVKPEVNSPSVSRPSSERQTGVLEKELNIFKSE